jgi:hypothetical protein
MRSKNRLLPPLYVVAVGIILMLMLQFVSCTHDPIISPGGGPIDTTTHPLPVDTTIKPLPVDSSLTGGTCDSNLIFFNRDILPIFTSSCAILGCHDARTAAEGYVFTDYKHITSRGIVSGKPGSSKVYTVTVSGNSRGIMPPFPSPPISSKQADLISRWITEGIKNDTCKAKSGCDTSSVSFAKDILPVFTNNCVGCHGTINSYSGIRLHNYANVKDAVATGRLLGSLRWEQGYIKMPQDQPQLLGCDIKKLEIWIRKGALNN